MTAAPDTSMLQPADAQVPVIRLTQVPEADAVLARNPFALLVGMVLDQQIPVERALAGPATISQRIGRELDPAELAGYDPEQFAAVLSRPPAVHRSPIAMAGRIQQLAAYISKTYGGDVTRMWSDRSTGADVVRRFEKLPGFGRPKARILLALLGKQLGVTPVGWREAAAPYGEEGSQLSLADVVDQASLDAVRSAKRARKLAKKAAAGRAGPAGEGFAPPGSGNEKPSPEVASQVGAGSITPHAVADTGVTGVRTPSSRHAPSREEDQS